MRASLLFLAFALVACKPRYIESTRDGVTARSAKLGLYTKEIVAKQPPETLVAADATICRVSPDVYRNSAEHTLVYCNWQ
jgi:hypothetical protein